MIARACLSCRRIYSPGPGASRGRCAPCQTAYQRARDARRGSAAQRGYKSGYQRNRAAILANGPHPCAWGCGRVADTVDHVVPLAHGGTNDIENLVPACTPCNSSRGSRPSPRTRQRGA